jgi:flagellar motility protein MotE (MotC chaperone)
MIIQKCLSIKILFLVFCFSFISCYVYAEEDIVSLVEKQRIELNQKEENIKREMERLKTLKREINEDIEKYAKLLKQIEKSLKQAEETGSKRLRHIAKAYEAMQPEDAASRLSGLDIKTAVQILLKMNSKKAGLAIGMMESKKATLLTKEIARLKK